MQTPALHADGIRIGYHGPPVIDGLSLDITTGGFTAIVGPNACGKSTLLRALGRMLVPSAGDVLLDGRAIGGMRGKEFARRVGLLPQSPIAPDAITVADLVARGRYPHQSLLRQWSEDDARITAEAIEEVGMAAHADRLVDELSGGQRQRAWIAMALAQETGVLLLDEPTTFLDIAHQIDVLELCARLAAAGRTVVAVLHDLNLAARYADRMVAMRDGRIIAEGTAEEVVTARVLREAYELEAVVIDDPETGRPLVVPRARRGAAR
ncbi:ABC transporter ATP-binding protein [Leucobacter allii]|uniref:ABC transporter ATP-binding protein n=1 Tax=Leucobacter allii TaxID=2932247 RepID=A0ABY4FH50_9MICO|nr:ABC transporter ATP-binding protein [Leucobacter allii]UOQ55828.1 ABC transporter ATP-binding protein [Leucobacter allii]